MNLPDAVAITVAGLAAGMANTIVGAGYLVTFPALIALGFSPLVANVTMTVGLVPGSLSGSQGYRQELSGQRRRVLVLGLCSLLGGLMGAALLLVAPGSFQRAAPWLVLLAVVLVVIQPRLTRLIATRGPRAHTGSKLFRAGVVASGVYGGYFGAAQGVILIGILALGLDDEIQRLNALKTLLGAVVNGTAAVVFAFTEPVAWAPAGLMAVGAVVGGQVGARVGKRLSRRALRAVIVIAGLASVVRLLA